MSKRSYQKAKVRGGSQFLALPHSILNHDNFIALSKRGRTMLIDVAVQYNGSNNGDLDMTAKRLRKRGWTSNDQIEKAKCELLEKGWMVLTRQGGRNMPSLFAITWWSIDACGGKLDVQPTRTPHHYWKTGSNPEYRKNGIILPFKKAIGRAL